MLPADAEHAAAPSHPAVGQASPPRARMGFTVAAIGGVALMAVTLAHPSTSRMHTWPWAAVIALLWLLPILAAVWNLWRAPTLAVPAGPTLALPLGLVALAVAVVISALASPFAAHALTRSWPTLGGVAFFFLASGWLATPRAATETRHLRLERALAWSGLAITTASLAAWFHAAWPSSPWGGRNAYPFGHSTYTAGFVVLVLPWFAARIFSSRGIARLGWTLAIGLGLLVIASTSSRGGVLGVVATTGFASLVVLGRAAWPRWQKWTAAAGLALAAVVVVLTNPRLRELVLQRRWSESAVESNRQRSAMIAAGFELGHQRPLTGWGAGAVPLAYPRVRAKLEGGVDNVLQLHSTPLQLWATLGTLGALAALLIVVGWVAAMARGITAQTCDSTFLAAASATFGYAVVALTDHQLDVPIMTTLLAANAAVLVAGAGEPRRVTLRPANRGAGSVIVVLLISAPLLALGRDLLARHAYEQAIVAWEYGRGGEMLSALDRATRLTPYDPFFQHQAAAELLHESARATPEQRSALRRAALERLETSLQTGVHEEFAHFNLGWLLLELGAPARAAAHFRAAAALVPDKGGVYFGLGLALEQSGARDAAIRAFALEWLNDPRNAFAPTWEIPAFAALRPAVQREALRLYDQLKGSHAPAAAAAAWFRWWLGETPQPPAPTESFSEASRQFAAAWPAIHARGPVTIAAKWAGLYSAWRQPSPAGFLRAAAGDQAFGAALARQAGRHGDEFRSFLVASTADDPALLRTFLHERTGYGVLALHPEGPPLRDLFVVQENRVFADFAGPLLPPKGWLPGRFLLALLPAEQR